MLPTTLAGSPSRSRPGVALRTMGHLAQLALDDVPGTISVWFGPAGGPATFTRLADEPHYAASLMKVPLLVALAAGHDLDRQVRVDNVFPSALGSAGPYGLDPTHDQDDQVWARLGDTARLGWLAERMIVVSANLAANLVLREVGLAAANDIWRAAGARVSRIERGLGDDEAREAGLTNTVSAADLAALLGLVASEARAVPTVGPSDVAAMTTDPVLGPLLRQERTEDLAAGLPPGTVVAHKNGWIRGIRHAAGMVFPTDAPPFVLAVCTTTPLAVNVAGDDSCQLIRTVAQAAWADRNGHPAAGHD
jgi:beta-lactamase class A